MPLMPPAGSTLSYSATGLPNGLAIDSTSGQISGYPRPRGEPRSRSPSPTALALLRAPSFTWTVNSYDITIRSPFRATRPTTKRKAVSLPVQPPTRPAVCPSPTLQPACRLASPSTPPAAQISGTIDHRAGRTATRSSPPIPPAGRTHRQLDGQLGHQHAVGDQPGNQTHRGQPVSLQLQAIDSTSGHTLTYSAAGLPDGLSIGSRPA